MEGSSNREERCPQLLDLIPREREWLLQREGQRRHVSFEEEKKLELRLGPPGEREGSLLSLGHATNSSKSNKRGFTDTIDLKAVEKGWIKNNNGSPIQKLSFPDNADLKGAEEKAFSPPASANTAVQNSSHKRNAAASVVGWPPIRSSRKNLASSSSFKQTPQSRNAGPSKIAADQTDESCRKSLFVKINMDGVPIGRKVDLQAHDSYEKLSSAVDQLFRGLLAAQRDSCADGIMNMRKEEKAITGLLDGSGEYTLVYEDNEGDRVLVGDVPWHMFVSTVKRLRVLRTSELSTLHVGSKQGKLPHYGISK